MKVSLLALVALAFAAPAFAQTYTTTSTPATTGYTTIPANYYPQTTTSAPVGTVIYAPTAGTTYSPVPVTTTTTTTAPAYQPLPCVIPYLQLTVKEQAGAALKALVATAVKAQKTVQTAVNTAGTYFQANIVLLDAYYRAKAVSEYTNTNTVPIAATAAQKAAATAALTAAKKAAAVPLAKYLTLVAAVETAQKKLVTADKAVNVKAQVIIDARTTSTTGTAKAGTR